jgi:hypothetical protein
MKGVGRHHFPANAALFLRLGCPMCDIGAVERLFLI